MADLATFPLGDGRRVAVNARSAEAALAMAEDRLRAGQGFALATLNLDHLVKLPRSAAFRDAYAGADIVVADGNPVVWLARLSGRPLTLAPGSDLLRPLCALAARLDLPVALVGATREALDRAAARLEADHRGLRVVLRHAPSMTFDPDGPEGAACAAMVAESGARLCLVALGAPKQEIFAARGATLAPGCGFASIGAGLDFVAGAQRRAPAWARRLALEWLWRLVHDPRRLARRYADCALILPRLAVDALRARRGAAAPAGAP